MTATHRLEDDGTGLPQRDAGVPCEHCGCEALNHGQPVGIVPEGTVSQVYREIEDVQVFDDRDRAVRFLVWPEPAVATDGGDA